MTTFGAGITEHDPETIHNWKPGKRDYKPDYLREAITAYNTATQAVTEAADRHEQGDPNHPEVTRAEVQRCLRALNHKKYLMEKAWLEFEAEEAAKAADWQDEQQMYAELRRGG
jgi:hypothetical protein